MKAPLSFTILFCLILLACKQTKDCPAFSDEKWDMIPYTQSDTLKYTNSWEEEFLVFIESRAASDFYTLHCRDLKGLCHCESFAVVTATDSRNSIPYSLIRLELFENSDAQIFRYSFYGMHFEFDFVNDLPYIDYFDNMEYMEELAIDNRTWYNVIVYYPSEEDHDYLSAIYFNKEYGVFRFKETKPVKDWVLN